MSVHADAFRSRLRKRETIVATFLMVPRVEIVGMLALAGFDAVVIDLEHAAVSFEDLVALTTAGRESGLASVVRLADGSASGIGKAFDCGADAVMVPHISSREQAEFAVSAARFPPEGQRSLNPYTLGNRYGMGSETSLEATNRKLAVIGMVEGEAAVQQLEAILAVEGLDAVFVGPVDLSGAMGYPGQPNHPQVVAQMELIFDRVAEHGRAAGLYVHDPDHAGWWIKKGASLLAVSADIAMAATGFETVRQRIERSSNSNSRPAGV